MATDTINCLWFYSHLTVSASANFQCSFVHQLSFSHSVDSYLFYAVQCACEYLKDITDVDCVTEVKQRFSTRTTHLQDIWIPTKFIYPQGTGMCLGFHRSLICKLVITGVVYKLYRLTPAKPRNIGPMRWERMISYPPIGAQNGNWSPWRTYERGVLEIPFIRPLLAQGISGRWVFPNTCMKPYSACQNTKFQSAAAMCILHLCLWQL